MIAGNRKNGRKIMKFDESWKDQQRPQEYPAYKLFFGAAGILCLALVGIVLIVVGLSL